ncbi:hypothetical protein HY449_00830 [Candidatus Pacearchaeota archaeon]|nr:hypothetical protein [Candidatus Pacearchaeota archaeon]
MNLNKFRHEINSLIFNGIFAILTLLTVIIFYKNILLTTVILSVLAIIALLKWKTAKVFIIFILGGFLGAFAEIIGVNYGAWSYSYASFLGVPAWIFFFWGNAAIFIYRLSNEIKKIKMKK